MIKPEIIHKIKELELYTKKMARGLLSGTNRSTVKGSGFDFDQIREYQEGDDIRFIDWKGTARVNKLLVRQYKEEKTRTIIVAVDISASSSFVSHDLSKQDKFAHIAGILSLVSSYQKDAVGLILFSDEVECFIPPSQGKQHIHLILEKLFSVSTKNKKTSISNILHYLAQLKYKDMLIFLLSDFIDKEFEKPLLYVSRKHELIAIAALDTREKELPHIGFVTMKDLETDTQIEIDLRSAHMINYELKQRMNNQIRLFARAGVDLLMLKEQKTFISDLTLFFRARTQR